MQVVEQERSASRGGNTSRAHAARVSVRTLHVAEELVERELRGHHADAERMKSTGASAEIVDVFGKERFSGAAFAVEDDRA